MPEKGYAKRYYALSFLWLALHVSAILAIGCILILSMTHFGPIDKGDTDVIFATLLLVSIWFLLYWAWSVNTSSKKDVIRVLEKSNGRWEKSGRCFICQFPDSNAKCNFMN